MPEALANQIAAGEVVQRPASVVKELLENAIDAGARQVLVAVDDGGKALIQVVDDGRGMMPADARMAFERHATSKLHTADDLMRILTFGFRGEALASIASVAQVTLRTRPAAEALGTEVRIDGGAFIHQQAITAPAGSSFSIRNLFYNLPARRKFVKSTPVEMRHIVAECVRVALAYPEVALRLEHNLQEVLALKAGTQAARMHALMPGLAQTDLLQVSEQTPLFTMAGYVTAPQAARKTRGDQYLYVNRRYVRDNYLHHAVMNCYEGLIAKDSHPPYVLFLTIDPSHVDVNIHPTKHEIKFDDERTVYALLRTAVRKALGSFHGMTLTDAKDNAEGLAGVFYGGTQPQDRQTLSEYRSQAGVGAGVAAGGAARIPALAEWKLPDSMRPAHATPVPEAWQELYARPADAAQQALPTSAAASAPTQLYDTYLLLEQPEGLLMIHQHRAHARVLYERLLRTRQALPVQQLLYPQTLKLSGADEALLQATLPILRNQGFAVQLLSSHEVLVTGVPFEMKHSEALALMDAVLAELHTTAEADSTPDDMGDALQRRLAQRIALQGAIPAGRKLGAEEMQVLVHDLMACSTPATDPAGRAVYWYLAKSELAARFEK